jgi:outer membrane protein
LIVALGGKVMSDRNKPTTIANVFVVKCLVFALSANVAQAADLASSPPAAQLTAVPEVTSRWFARFGALGVIDQSSSRLFAQPIAGVVVPGIGFVPVGGAGSQALLAGRGATYSNIFSASVQAGYFFTPNWSLELSGGVPIWVKAKITGFSPTAPVSGTVLAELLGAAVPVTVVYHFTQFGALQPYLGGGIVPSFALAVRDGFNTGGSFEPALGLVLQAGSEYMFNRNWGVFFDVKKLFIQTTGKATGIDLGPPIGTIPAAATIKTNFQPWLFATGFTYRF